MEIKVKCGVCDSRKMCIEERSEETYPTTFMCFRCGFMSNATFVDDNETYKDYLEKSLQIVRDSAVFDDFRQIYWLPVVLNIPDKGIVYPKKHEEENHIWVAQTYVKSDRAGFDMELSDESFEYDKYNFFEAAKSIGIHLTEEAADESNFGLS